MVAIFTGSGTGLENGSGSVLGGAGLHGQSAMGRAGENLFFNAANGNLVVSQQDEFLVGRGPDVGISRTYNSQGTWDGDNGDNWQFAGKRRWHSYVAGVSVTRTGADGSDIDYSYVGADTYRAKDGGGAHDELKRLSNGAWVRTDGDSRTKETYDSGGNLISVADSDGNTVSYTYDYYNNGYRLIGVSTSDGSQVTYSYSGNNVTKITTSYSDLATNTAKTLTRTYYAYDGQNRLIKVTTDLSPQNNSVSDGKVYETHYTYEGSSKRITTISQTDGSKLDIAYDAQGRVTEFKQTVAAGETRTTRIGYGVNVTSVTDPTDQVTRFYYDTDGQLVQLMSPPAYQGGPAQVTQFEYDADGNVIRTIETDAANASVANNLVKASGWGDGEVASRGDNLVDDSGWPQDVDGALPVNGTIGQGFTGAYTDNETEWTVTSGPYGENVISLHTGQADTGADGGGAVSDNFAIDKSKTYEFTLYFKADELSKHQVYFGLGSGVVKNGDNGVYNGNPYFSYDLPSASTGIEANKWYKIVGYVLPDGTATEPWGSYGGIFDVQTGDKVRDIRHFIWDGSQSGTATYSRFFNFYNTQNQGKFTHFYKPEVREVSDVAMLRDGQKLDIDRDANFLLNSTVAGWNNIPWANNHDEARWSELVGPDGSRQVGLETGEFDGTASAGHNGGGGYTNQFEVDPNKTYKFTQYVRKSDLSRHYLYFGLSSSSTPYVKYGANGTDATNPYFMAWGDDQQRNQLQEDRWYKVVGYVLPKGSANRTGYDLGGVFDAETGAQVGVLNSFRWHENMPNTSVHARFFNYYDQTEHGWSTEWLAPEVVEIDNADLAADNANPFGVVYDESAPQTFFEYDANGNVTKVTDPNGNVTSRTYDASNNMLTETITGVNEHASVTGNLTPTLSTGWALSNLQQSASSPINGQEAVRYDVANGAGHGAFYKNVGTVKAGDTVSFQITVKANDGYTSHMLGLYGNVSGWGGNAAGESEGYILDGPGEIVQTSSGYWYVTGLSETEATTIEVRRTYAADQYAYPHFYIDHPHSTTGGSAFLTNPITTVLRKDFEVVSPTDITQWGHGGVAVESAGTLNGAPARKFTSAVGATWSGVSDAFSAKKGETVVFDMTVQAVGSTTTQQLGLYGNTSGWNAGVVSSAKIVSGPGTISQSSGGLWTVSGLSNAAPTRIQVTRTFDRDESGGAYLYIDLPGGFRDGEALIAAAPKVTKFAANSTPELTTRYVYDSENHLRYSISAEGKVKEYYYAANGQMYWQVDYPQASYDVSTLVADQAPTEAQLNAWRTGLDNSQSKITYHSYDARGNLYRSITYSGSQTNWGYADSADGYDYTYFTYDQAGNLLERQNLDQNPERFVYDGMNRLIASSDLDGGVTTIYFNDSASQTIVRLADGATTTSTFNKAGDLISQNESHVGHLDNPIATNMNAWVSGRVNKSGAGVIDGTFAYRYTVNATGPYGYAYGSSTSVAAGETVSYRITLKAGSSGHTHRLGLYGSHSAWIENEGNVQAIILDGPGEINPHATNSSLIDVSDLSTTETTTIEIRRTYSVAQTARGYLYVGGTGSNVAAGTAVIAANPSLTKTVTNTSLDYNDTSTYTYDRNGRLRMEIDATGYRTYFLYDKQGRKIADIDHNGSVVEYKFDDQGSVLSTTRFYNPVSADDRNLLANPDSDIEMDDIRPDAGAAIWAWTVYDDAGRVLQDIDGDGRVTSYQYDNADRLIRTIGYHNQLTTAQITSFRDTPPEAQILPAAHAKDVIIRTFYDRDGRVVGALNGEGYLTRSFYDNAGQLIRETAYANPTSSALRANGTLTELYDSIALSTSKDLVTRNVYDGQGLLRYSIDATLNVTSYQYNRSGQLKETVVHAAPITSPGSDFSFLSIKAKVAAIANNTNDRKSTIVYNSSGQVATTTDASGLVTSFTYDKIGHVIKSVAGSGASARIFRNWYDGKGQLRYTANAEGYVTENRYDAEGRLTNVIRYETAQSFNDVSLINAVSSAVAADYAATRFQQESYSHDAQGRVVNSYDGLNTRTHYWYRGNGERAYSSTATGTGDEAVIFYRNFNQAGQVTWDRQGHDNPEQRDTNYYYDGLGNLVRVLDPEGGNTYFTHDKNGNILTETDSEGGVTSYQYDAFGNAVKVTDARDNITYNYYDNENRLIKSLDAEGYITETSYNSFGEVASVKRWYNEYTPAPSVNTIPSVAAHAKDAVTQFEYDKLGRITKTIDAEGYYEQYTLDAFGNRVSVRNKLGGVITNVYDKRGLLISETLPMTSVRSNGVTAATSITNSFEYDSRGNRTKMIEASNLAEITRTTEYVYDKADRLIETIGEGPHGYVPHEYITYDARGNITSTTNAAGARTIFFYDDLNRKTVEINAVGTYTAYTYDKNGNVLTARVYENAVAVPADGGAKEETPTAPSGGFRETVFTYDNLNRLKTTTVAGVNSYIASGSSYTLQATSIVVANEYDANGNLVKQSGANGHDVYFYYDKLGRKIAQVDQERYRTDWTYDGEGNVTRERRYINKAAAPSIGTPPAVTSGGTADRITDYLYDKVGNRTHEYRYYVDVHNGSGAQTQQNSVAISYVYNGLGQVTRKTEATGDQTNYTYDQIGRLTQEQKAAFDDYRPGTTNVTPTTDYYYDGLNNLTRTRQQGVSGTAERVTRYNYDGGKQINMIDANGVYTTYYYDIAGRKTYEYYSRVGSDGSYDNTYEGVNIQYDALGRAIEQRQVVYNSGVGWTDVGPSTKTGYNAFGEVVSVSMGTYGAHGSPQIQNKYDKVGRLWATNSNGTWQYFAHDAAGNQTVAIASAGFDISSYVTHGLASALTLPNHSSTVVRDGVNGTFSHYDKRGQATQVVEEGRQLNSTIGVTLTSSRTYNAFGEVLSETNALGHTTNYTYNNMGRLIKKESPYISITGANGAVTNNYRPTENYYYDASGRMVASRDANSNLTRLTLLAGTGYDGSEALVTQEIHADGGIKKTEYDRLGNARRMTDEINRVTAQNFDAMGRVTQITKPNGLNTYYTYDGLGQRLTEWNSVLGSGNKQTTDYDAQGRVTATRAFGGDVITKTYVWNGSLTTTGLGTFGGWVETTSTVSDRYSAGDYIFAASETSDIFGNLITRSDASGQVYNYTYDVGGRLTLETSNLVGGAAWKRNIYSYYNSGQIKQISSGDTPVTNTNWARTTSNYGYDALGRLTNEKLVAEKGVYTPAQTIWLAPGEPEYIPASYTVTNTVRQDGHATYDAAGRMTRYYDDAPSGAHNVDKTWAYDAAGNVRKISSTYRPVNADGTLATGTATQTYWYAYDNMNRVVTSRGQLVGGQIVRGATAYGSTAPGGVDILYNKAGERIQAISTKQFYDIYTGYTNVDNVETYTYNNDGQITQTRINNVLRGTTSFDLLGRVNGHAEYSAANVLAHERYGIVYDARNQVIAEKTKTKQGSNWIHTHTVNYYSAAGVGGHGGAITHYNQVGSSTGSLLHYSETKNWSSSSSALPGYLSSADYAYADSYTTQTYRWSEGPQQASVHLVNRDGTSNSAYQYDKNDHLVAVNITGGNRPRTISFENSREGQILSRREADNNYAQNDPSQRTYSFGGKQMGTVGNDGTDNVDYDQSIINRTTVQGTGAFRNGATTGALYADFDQNYTAINGTSQQDTSNIYTAQGGESLAQVAAAVWGDSALWYKLAQANGLSGSETLTKGRTINIPSNVGGINHNAGTFKVYDPAKAIGDTSPNTPEPPKKSNKCGVFGQILVSVIAIAVTAIAPLGGGFFAQIGNAVLGSVVSQGFGVATGIQDKFSFKSVALSAIGAGVGAGVGQIANGGAIAGSQFLGDVVRGAVGSTITQGIGVATGLQNKFSFAGVAAAGIGAGIGGAVLRALSDGEYASGKTTVTRKDGSTFDLGKGSWLPSSEASFGALAASTAVNTLANAATRSAIEGRSFGDNIQRAIPDAIGQLVGGVLGRGIAKAFEEKSGDTANPVEETQGDADTIGEIVVTRMSGLRDINSIYLPDHPLYIPGYDEQLWTMRLNAFSPIDNVFGLIPDNAADTANERRIAYQALDEAGKAEVLERIRGPISSSGSSQRSRIPSSARLISARGTMSSIGIGGGAETINWLGAFNTSIIGGIDGVVPAHMSGWLSEFQGDIAAHGSITSVAEFASGFVNGTDYQRSFAMPYLQMAAQYELENNVSNGVATAIVTAMEGRSMYQGPIWSSMRLPDYVSIGIDVNYTLQDAVGHYGMLRNDPITIAAASVVRTEVGIGLTGNLTIDRYGSVYVSPFTGSTEGIAGKGRLSIVGTANWMNGRVRPSERQLHNFITGPSQTLTLSRGAAFTQTWNDNGSATGLGVGGLEVSSHSGHTFHWFDIGE